MRVKNLKFIAICRTLYTLSCTNINFFKIKKKGLIDFRPVATYP